MSQKRARHRRVEARSDVVRLIKTYGQPPAAVNVAVAAQHCRRCRLRFWISSRMLRGIRRHNVEADEWMSAVGKSWQS